MYKDYLVRRVVAILVEHNPVGRNPVLHQLVTLRFVLLNHCTRVVLNRGAICPVNRGGGHHLAAFGLVNILYLNAFCVSVVRNCLHVVITRRRHVINFR